jgi:pimeloyl-ACP methyl ester carboxylesterase
MAIIAENLPSNASGETSRKVIVLVHGWGANRGMMWLLGMRLARRGYRTINWGYLSLSRSIESHANDLHDALTELEQDPEVDEFFLVGHSMGSIVSRTAVTRCCDDCGPFTKLRRMVMLAPPNRGSHLASWLGPWLKPIIPTLDQLADRADSYVNCLPIPEKLDIGIIAAQYDGLVNLSNTYLGIERDHLICPHTIHSGVLFHQGVVDQIVHFLEHGCFVRERQRAMSA